MNQQNDKQNLLYRAIEYYDCIFKTIFRYARCYDGVPLLLLRLIVAPVLIIAGLHKFETFSATAGWFGETLGLPFPAVMTFLAATTELVGGVMLLFGLGIRIITLPLAFTMIVAIFSVHWQHGWFAIAPGSPDTNPARVFAAVGISSAKHSLHNSTEVGKRVREARRILNSSGRQNWLTAKGNFVILQNGIEFAAMYFVILLLLFFFGGGRYVSIDYWLDRKLRPDQPM